MKSELKNVQNPYKIYFFWAFLYSIFVAVLVIGFINITSKIRTHSLPNGSITLDVPYSKYLLGEPVTFSLKNNYNSSVYVINNCPTEPLEVYRLENKQWIRLHDTVPISECENEPRIINVPANGVVNGSFAPWKHLFNKPGKYRIVAFVEYYNELPYKDIEVIVAPKPVKSSNTNPKVNNSAPTPNLNTDNEESTTTLPPPNNTYTPKKTKTISTSSGSITVQYDSTNVYVISIAPASGCTYEGGNSGIQVEVTFKCGGSETQVQLWVSNGQLVTKIESGG